MRCRRRCCRSLQQGDITSEELKNMVAQGAILIDVRSKQEYQEGHIQGAINICLYDLEKNIEKKVKNRQAKIILYCASGVRSKKAREILENMGYKDVYSLKYGILEVN